MTFDLGELARKEIKAGVSVLGDTGKAILHVSIGDCYRNVHFEMPSLLTDKAPDWRSGELRKVYEAGIVWLCAEIVKHKSPFKCREHCVRNTPVMAPCPCAEEEP